MTDLTHEQNVQRSIELARANAAANRPSPAGQGDRATQRIREEMKIEKYESEEAKAAGEPPFETMITTIESVVDQQTGEVLSRRIVSPDEIPNVSQVPIDI